MLGALKSLAICGKAVMTTVESISSMHSAQPMIIGTRRDNGRVCGRVWAMVTQGVLGEDTFCTVSP